MLSASKSGYLVVQGRERFDLINQMQDHSRWLFPMAQPIKRTTADHKSTEYGVLRVDHGRVESRVYHKSVPWVVTEDYATFDDLVDAGWRVD